MNAEATVSVKASNPAKGKGTLWHYKNLQEAEKAFFEAKEGERKGKLQALQEAQKEFKNAKGKKNWFNKALAKIMGLDSEQKVYQKVKDEMGSSATDKEVRARYAETLKKNAESTKRAHTMSFLQTGMYAMMGELPALFRGEMGPMEAVGSIISSLGVNLGIGTGLDSANDKLRAWGESGKAPKFLQGVLKSNYLGMGLQVLATPFAYQLGSMIGGGAGSWIDRLFGRRPQQPEEMMQGGYPGGLAATM